MGNEAKALLFLFFCGDGASSGAPLPAGGRAIGRATLSVTRFARPVY